MKRLFTAIWVSVFAVLAVAADFSATSTPNFVQAGAGAVGRAVTAKLQDSVSAKDFGAKGDGIADDQPAIQRAIDTGRGVYLPNGVYKLGAPLTLAGSGQRLFGESLHSTYLTSSAATEHDLLRVSGPYAEVSGLHFRPGAATNTPVRIYAASTQLRGNRFLSASNGAGTAIVLTDHIPGGGTVAGAYSHIIADNLIGADGYAFAVGIDGSANNINATKFLNNKFLGDLAIRILRGGGNTYYGNLFQSATGSIGAKVGTALDLGTGVYGEMIAGNYFERYDKAIITRTATNTYQAFVSTGNHFDNCANNHYATMSHNYVAEDTGTLRQFRNGWTDDYSSAGTRVYNGLTGGKAVLTLDDTNKAIKTNKEYSPLTTLSYTADGQTQTPSARLMQITGAGAARTGAVLGTSGVQDGQRLTLLGMTWGVSLTNTNVRFASNAASVVFGNGAGNIQAMELVYLSSLSKWIEVSRTVY